MIKIQTQLQIKSHNVSNIRVLLAKRFHSQALKPISRQVFNEVIDPIKKLYPNSKYQRVEPSNQEDYKLAIIPLTRSSGENGLEVVQKIGSLLNKNVIDKLTYSDPGFMNISLNNTWISRQLHELTKLPGEGVTVDNNETKKRKVLVDFASPNFCKELHVGHLRSMVLGDTISRILSYLGHEVERISHVGDFGTPIAIVIAQAIDTKVEFIENIRNKKPYTMNASYLSNIYVSGKKRSKQDPSFVQFVNQILSQVQRCLRDPSTEDPDHIFDIYKAVVDASRESYQDILKRLNINNLVEKGESYYAPQVESVVKELKEKGVAKESNGAQCIFVPGNKTPFLIEKSDGTHLYATTDLAALRYRINHGKDWIIYVTDDTQKSHFQQLFKAGEMAGWVNPSIQLNHLTFGVVRGSDGQKLSSRDGSPLTLVELLNEAVVQCKKTQKPGKLLTEEEQEKTAIAVGYAALKYFDLRHSRDYIFSYDSMLSLKGNTAVYLLYAYVRICALLRKASESNLREARNIMIELKEPEERKLAFQLIRFADSIIEFQKSLSPGVICDYIYDTANLFHVFYEKCPIIGNPNEISRLHLCLATQKVMWQSLTLLGIQPLEKM